MLTPKLLSTSSASRCGPLDAGHVVAPFCVPRIPPLAAVTATVRPAAPWHSSPAPRPLADPLFCLLPSGAVSGDARTLLSCRGPIAPVILVLWLLPPGVGDHLLRLPLRGLLRNQGLLLWQPLGDRMNRRPVRTLLWPRVLHEQFAARCLFAAFLARLFILGRIEMAVGAPWKVGMVIIPPLGGSDLRFWSGLQLQGAAIWLRPR